jgi:hypothetical protein
MVVFSSFQYNQKPCVLFYDIDRKEEKIRVDGASMFLHMKPLKEHVQFTFFSDSRYCDEVIENSFGLRGIVSRIKDAVPDEKL